MIDESNSQAQTHKEPGAEPSPEPDTGATDLAPSEPPPSAKPASSPKPSAKRPAHATLAAAGIPTSKPAPPSSKKGRSKKPAVVEVETGDADGEDKTFDPAADLPMYREGMDWFVLRVASNKENYVRETLLRKVQIEGLDQRVGRIMVPTEKTKTLKGGKTRIAETKLYPGYIFVEMQLDRTAAFLRTSSSSSRRPPASATLSAQPVDPHR